MILRKFNMFFFSTLRDRSNPTFGKQRLKYPSMGRNLIKKTLISANIFMIGLCLYAWSIDKPYSGKVDFIEPSKNLPPLQVFEHQRNIFKSAKKSKNVITQVKVFPRGGDDLKFDNLPWMIPPTKMHSLISDLKLDQRFIMSNFSYSPGEVVMDFSVELELTGLGNLMFQYASLRALAESHNATLILPSKTLLRRAFGNFDNKVLFFQPSVIDLYLSENKGHEYTECCKYYSNISLFANKNGGIEIVNGYFQSFKYFYPKQHDFIKEQFKFLPDISEKARKALEDAKFKLWDEELNVDSGDQGNDVVVKLPDTFDADYYFVGIHVRHGLDITMHSRNLRHGHTFASIDYYQKAIQYFIKEFNWRKIIFVVAGDDITWAKKVFAQFPKEKFLYVESGQREIDMATLRRCNGMIMSTGTFSWWTAFLTNGPVVYYSGWPRKSSELDSLVNKKDYFLPSWIPL